MDFSIICRFCMAKDGTMLDISKDTVIKAKAHALLPNLKLLDDGLPNGICRCCIYQLQAAYKFKRKCELTDIILREHLQRTRSSSTSSSCNTNVPVEIKIDSDDDDDAGNISEPLVVLPSTVTLEDQDPLDLGHEIQNFCDAYSCNADSQTMGHETVLYPRHSKTVLTQNLHHSGVMCGNLDDSNANIPKLEVKKSFNIDCCSVEQNSSDSAQVNDSIANIPKLEVKKDFNIDCCSVEQNSSDSAQVNDSNANIPKLEVKKSFNIDCCSVEQNSSDSAQVNSSAEEHFPASEHILNQNCEKPQYETTAEAGRYRCPVCSLLFVSRYQMDLHLTNHDGETPYPCPICKKGFRREGGLKAHLKVHTREKPHKCEVCNKEFSLKGNLKVHQRLHTGEKPFQCTTCMKAFTQKISLIKHLTVHREVQ